MATKMKVKKGDMVQMITGKDRGKRGRVIEARPSERRVIVETPATGPRCCEPGDAERRRSGSAEDSRKGGGHPDAATVCDR
jgi:ribosomal protein L24